MKDVPSEQMVPQRQCFAFRPWVRRAGASIVLVAAAVTAAMIAALAASPAARWGWLGEPFVRVYVGALWAGGLKVWLGTRRPVAEADERTLTLRPLHQLRSRTVEWSAVRATEQMVGGDRLIVWFETARGPRFVALNLNLVKGRREFLRLLDDRLLAMGFSEQRVERSRILSAPGAR